MYVCVYQICKVIELPEKNLRIIEKMEYEKYVYVLYLGLQANQTIELLEEK